MLLLAEVAALSQTCLTAGGSLILIKDLVIIKVCFLPAKDHVASSADGGDLGV